MSATGHLLDCFWNVVAKAFEKFLPKKVVTIFVTVAATIVLAFLLYVMNVNTGSRWWDHVQRDVLGRTK